MAPNSPQYSRRSTMRHRPIGIGVQGPADTFMALRMPFDSTAAKELNIQIFETIYHAAVWPAWTWLKRTALTSHWKAAQPAKAGFNLTCGTSPRRTFWEWDAPGKPDHGSAGGYLSCSGEKMMLMINVETSMHFYGWKKALKTGMYLLRTRPAAQAIQFTVDQSFLKKKTPAMMSTSLPSPSPSPTSKAKAEPSTPKVNGTAIVKAEPVIPTVSSCAGHSPSRRHHPRLPPHLQMLSLFRSTRERPRRHLKTQTLRGRWRGSGSRALGGKVDVLVGK
ncbi:hypothetical protein JB92DRAFT_2831215 [Gautieria morchelliformis]|nr:hypothetical protein JB92DRAFT_2831215 [Gautieria morchelliformis]